MKVRDLLLSSSALIASVAVVATVNPSISAQTKTHTVEHGEYLSLIASKYGITVKNIIDWNQLTTNYLYSGQQLVVTNPSQEPSVTPTRPETNPPASQPSETPSTEAPSNETPSTSSQPSVESTTPRPMTQGTYTVRPGDSLWAIANRHGMTISQLKQVNGLRSNMIHPGDRLKVVKETQSATRPQPSRPANPSERPAQPRPTETPSNPSNRTQTVYYTVKPGDSLWLISNKYGLTINELKRLNGLASNMIHPGNKLRVGKSEAPAQPSQPVQPTPTPQPEDKDESVNQPTPSPAQPREQATKYYTVQSGDYLWKIANDHHITVAQLKAWNNLTSNYIYAGNRLIVAKGTTDGSTRPERPKPEEKPEEEAPQPTPSPQPTTYYTVKPGDSLWKIANQFGVTINQIKAWNRMTSNMIHPGDRLLVSNGKGEDSGHTPRPETPPRDGSDANLSGVHEAVQNVLNQYQNASLSVFFESAVNGDSRTASWNADSQAFYGASSTKLVLLGYVQDQIEKGIISWDTRFPYTNAAHQHPESYFYGTGGSGDIRFQPGYWNKTYSVRYLVEKVTSISDNLAADLLLHHVGYRNRADLNRFTQEAYGDSSYDRNISAREFTKLVKHIWQQKDPTVKQLLTHTQSDGTRIDAIPVKTHQKTGDYGGFHNAAGYVEGQKPFYLTILTRAWSDSAIGNLANQIYRAVNR